MSDVINAENLDLVVQILQGIIVLIGIGLYIKRGQYDKALQVIEHTFSRALTTAQKKSKLLTKEGMKREAVKVVKNSVADVKVQKALKKVGLNLTDDVIDDFIETTLSSGKLNVPNPIRKFIGR